MLKEPNVRVLAEALLGLLHHLQDWRIAHTIAEHADADVDLEVARIGIAHGDQGEKRVTLNRRQIRKAWGLRGGFGQHGNSD